MHGITGHNFETRHPSNDSDQVWFNWSSSFRGKNLWKSLRRTTNDDDDGRQVMAMAHLAQRPGELKIFSSETAQTNITKTRNVGPTVYAPFNIVSHSRT